MAESHSYYLYLGASLEVSAALNKAVKLPSRFSHLCQVVCTSIAPKSATIIVIYLRKHGKGVQFPPYKVSAICGIPVAGHFHYCRLYPVSTWLCVGPQPCTPSQPCCLHASIESSLPYFACAVHLLLFLVPSPEYSGILSERGT